MRNVGQPPDPLSSPGLSQVSPSSQSPEQSAFPFTREAEPRLLSPLLEESRFVCLAEAREELRRHAGLDVQHASPPAVLRPGSGIEEHIWLAGRLRGEQSARPRRRLRVVVFGQRAGGPAELAALLSRETAVPRKIFYQGRLRTTICRVPRPSEDFELKVVEFPVLEDAHKAWESLERALERGLALTARQQDGPGRPEDFCIHLLLYCLQPEAGVSWLEAVALRRLQPLLALVPVAMLSRPATSAQLRDLKQKFSRDSLATSVEWWSVRGDAEAERLSAKNATGPPPLFAVSTAGDGGDLRLLWALLPDHIGRAGAQTARIAAEKRARQRAQALGLGVGACAGAFVGALAALTAFRLFNR